MQSKNKAAMTVAERAHVERIKGMPCAICAKSAPSEAHELEQGQWFTAVPLCEDCHRGKRNGIHGERNMWRVMHMNELQALNETLRAVFVGRRIA